MPILTAEFEELEKFINTMDKLKENSEEIAMAAVYEGTRVAANEIKDAIRNIPEEPKQNWYMRPGQRLYGIPGSQIDRLAKSMGISPFEKDRHGAVNKKIGFHGYDEKRKTKTYPNGLPFQMLAGAIESGSSVRIKTPYFRPAVERCRERTLAAMVRAAEEEIERILKG